MQTTEEKQTDSTAPEDTGAMVYADRCPATFPEARAFGDLFLYATPDKTKAPAPHVWRFEDVDFYTSRKYGNRSRIIEGRASIGPYMYITPGGDVKGARYHRALYVTPTRALVESIKATMLPINYDTINFKVIVFADGFARVWSEYSQISGSRLIAEISADSVPGIVPGTRADYDIRRDGFGSDMTSQLDASGALVAVPELDGVRPCGLAICKKCREMYQTDAGHTVEECAARLARDAAGQ